MTVPRRIVIALALFVAITAIGGGVTLAVAGSGLLPMSWLEHTPFATFLVPGLLLAIVVGGTSLTSAVLMWQRVRAGIDATVVAGGALTMWIVAELAMLRAGSWLHALYGAIGLALFALGARAAWRARNPRFRWMLAVVAAETAGYLAPAIAGIAVTRAGVSPSARVAVLAAAGFVEGFVLGTGEAHALPFRVRRLRFALYTGAAAALVWASVMAMMVLAHPLAFAPAVAIIGLAAIGSAQWLELRHHRPRAWGWIGWTALAWTLALPLSFTPGPFVDETTPFAVHVALWGIGGLLMAAVLSVITWQGVKRLSAV
jgi:hypothetical protein